MMDERFIIRRATVGDLGCVSVPSVSGPPEIWTRPRAHRCRGTVPTSSTCNSSSRRSRDMNVVLREQALRIPKKRQLPRDRRESLSRLELMDTKVG